MPFIVTLTFFLSFAFRSIKLNRSWQNVICWALDWNKSYKNQYHFVMVEDKTRPQFQWRTNVCIMEIWSYLDFSSKYGNVCWMWNVWNQFWNENKVDSAAEKIICFFFSMKSRFWNIYLHLAWIKLDRVKLLELIYPWHTIQGFRMDHFSYKGYVVHS